MKTVGQRIKQARIAAGITGEALALAVGYKNQSAISAIESRTTGQGGHHIDRIAQALRVPLEWLLEGPDGPDVPFISPATPAPQSYPAPPAYQPLHVSEPSPPSYAPPIDASISESIQLFRQLTTTQRAEVLAHMQRLLSARAANPASTTPRSDHPQSSQPAPKTFYKLSACN